MLSIILVLIASSAAIVRANWVRALICAVVLIPASLHYLVFNDASGFEYYGTAAVSSLLIITVLNYIPSTPLSVDIQSINFIYIIMHFIGFAMYSLYLDPFWYNALVLVVFLIEFARLILITKKDVKHGAYNKYGSVYINAHSCRVSSGR